MTRGPKMAETRWSLDAGAPVNTMDVESTSTAPPVCSYRAMYRHTVPTGSLSSGDGMGSNSLSPDQQLVTPNPSSLSAPSNGYGMSPSEWGHRDRDHHFPMDLARIQVKPNVKTSVARTPELDSVGRSVNERLDKYVVIRQRTFHGLLRSRKEMRMLPLTDPRETVSADLTPTWLHRSKTDMYIERWRSKTNGKHRQRSKSGSSALDLRGMTLGSLFESLPSAALGTFSSPCSSRKEVTFAPELVAAPASNGSETRFPPLTSNRTKQNVETSGRTSSQRDQLSVSGLEAVTAPTPPSLKYASRSTPKDTSPSLIHVLPAPGGGGKASGEGGGVESSSFLPSGLDATQQQSESPRGPKGKGRLRKQPLAAIPLQLWEPSLDCVVVSSQKLLQPRQKRAWPGATVRQQFSPLK